MKAIVNIGFLLLLAGVVMAIGGNTLGGGLILVGFALCVIGRMGQTA